jgi:hypothetical protein
METWLSNILNFEDSLWIEKDKVGQENKIFVKMSIYLWFHLLGVNLKKGTI